MWVYIPLFTYGILAHSVVSAVDRNGKQLSINDVIEKDIFNKDVLDDVNTYVNKMKNRNEDKVQFYESSNVRKFTDFIHQLAKVLKGFRDTNLERFVTIFNDEIKKYHYTGCRFYELTDNFGLRKCLYDYLSSFERVPGKLIRSKLRELSDTLHDRNNRLIRDALVFLNTLYKNGSSGKFVKILNELQTYKQKKKKKKKELVRIIKNGIRSVIFDHYTELNLNTRVEIKSKLDDYWDKFKLLYGDDIKTTTKKETDTNEYNQSPELRAKIESSSYEYYVEQTSTTRDIISIALNLSFNYNTKSSTTTTSRGEYMDDDELNNSPVLRSYSEKPVLKKEDIIIDGIKMSFDTHDYRRVLSNFGKDKVSVPYHSLPPRHRDHVPKNVPNKYRRAQQVVYVPTTKILQNVNAIKNLNQRSDNLMMNQNINNAVHTMTTFDFHIPIANVYHNGTLDYHKPKVENRDESRKLFDNMKIKNTSNNSSDEYEDIDKFISGKHTLYRIDHLEDDMKVVKHRLGNIELTTNNERIRFKKLPKDYDGRKNFFSNLKTNRDRLYSHIRRKIPLPYSRQKQIKTRGFESSTDMVYSTTNDIFINITPKNNNNRLENATTDIIFNHYNNRKTVKREEKYDYTHDKGKINSTDFHQKITKGDTVNLSTYKKIVLPNTIYINDSFLENDEDDRENVTPIKNIKYDQHTNNINLVENEEKHTTYKIKDMRRLFTTAYYKKITRTNRENSPLIQEHDCSITKSLNINVFLNHNCQNASQMKVVIPSIHYADKTHKIEQEERHYPTYNEGRKHFTLKSDKIITDSELNISSMKKENVLYTTTVVNNNKDYKNKLDNVSQMKNIKYDANDENRDKQEDENHPTYDEVKKSLATQYTSTKATDSYNKMIQTNEDNSLPRLNDLNNNNLLKNLTLENIKNNRENVTQIKHVRNDLFTGNTYVMKEEGRHLTTNYYNQILITNSNVHDSSPKLKIKNEENTNKNSETDKTPFIRNPIEEDTLKESFSLKKINTNQQNNMKVTPESASSIGNKINYENELTMEKLLNISNKLDRRFLSSLEREKNATIYKYYMLNKPTKRPISQIKETTAIYTTKATSKVIITTGKNDFAKFISGNTTARQYKPVKIVSNPPKIPPPNFPPLNFPPPNFPPSNFLPLSLPPKIPPSNFPPSNVPPKITPPNLPPKIPPPNLPPKIPPPKIPPPKIPPPNIPPPNIPSPHIPPPNIPPPNIPFPKASNATREGTVQNNPNFNNITSSDNSKSYVKVKKKWLNDILSHVVYIENSINETRTADELVPPKNVEKDET